jgi:hypothetical protein
MNIATTEAFALVFFGGANDVTTPMTPSKIPIIPGLTPIKVSMEPPAGLEIAKFSRFVPAFASRAGTALFRSFRAGEIMGSDPFVLTGLIQQRKLSGSIVSDMNCIQMDSGLDWRLKG